MSKRNEGSPAISDAEWVLMREIWSLGQGTARDLIERLEGRRSWKPKTIKTLLRRLTDKGALGFEKTGREYLYRPLVSREEAERKKSDSFIERVFEGQTAPLLEHVTSNSMSNPTPDTPAMTEAINEPPPPFNEPGNATDRDPKIVGINPENFDPRDLGELEWNWRNALRATEPHAAQWKEAMGFLDPVIKRHPEFLEARKLMRKAAVGAELRIPLSDRIPPPQSYIGKARKKLEVGSPFEAMEILEEKVLVYLPTSSKAGIVLHEAALEAGLPKTALFALEFAAEKNPDEREIYQRLADHYVARDELEKACDALKQITHIDPTDPSAAKAFKNMVARASMRGGKIEEKDRGERIELEQRSRLAMTDDQKRSEMKVLVAEYERVRDGSDPKDADELADAKGGLKRAVQFARELGEKELRDLEYAQELQQLLVEAYPEDPVLVAELDQLTSCVAARRLRLAEEEYSRSETPGERDEREAHLSEVRSAAAETILEVAQRAAHANPTKGEAQLNLGRALIGAGKHREAVSSLQRAKKEPRSGIDIEAMGLLSDCFLQGKLTDLAQVELETAIEKLVGRGSEEADRQWKELKYKLALLFENSDRGEEAKRLFSEIYSKDSEFEDVEQRVWGG